MHAALLSYSAVVSAVPLGVVKATIKIQTMSRTLESFPPKINTAPHQALFSCSEVSEVIPRAERHSAATPVAFGDIL